MNSGSESRRTRVQQTLACRNAGPPPFMPAIYEYKAALIDETPSRIARDPELLYAAIMAEYEQLAPDALCVGVDVYNIEAEAMGRRVLFFDDDRARTPIIEPQGQVPALGNSLDNAPLPNPRVDGRMPVYVEAARRVVKALGDAVWIRGALSGPFSLAASLVGAPNLFSALLERPAEVHRLLRHAGSVVKQYGQAFVDVGVGVVIFDSQASTDLISPETFCEFVAPVAKDLIGHFQRQGLDHVPLIIGGNTAPISQDCIDTGANNLLCDFSGDWPAWLAHCRAARRALRRNISPAFIRDSTPDAVHAATLKMIADASGYGGFIVGTGVLPIDTPVHNVLAIRDACTGAVTSL